MTTLPDYEAWAIFAKVAERNSFSQAAAELGLAKTTVSKAVTRLEERMRTTLLHRTTRHLSLTESGRISLQRATRILNEGAAVEAEILEDATTPQGQLRVACNISFGIEQVSRLLPDFIAKYPGLNVDLQLIDTPMDIVAEGIDLAIRVGPISEASLRISRLFSFRMLLVAAPAFLAARGVPNHPEDLKRFPTLIFTHVSGSQDWHFTHKDHGVSTVHVDGAWRFNNTLAAVPAVVGGLAISLMPEIYAWRDIQDGRLASVLPEWRIDPIPVSILTPPGRARPARVRVLTEFLKQAYAAAPWAVGVER